MTTQTEVNLLTERQGVLGGSDIGALYNLDWGCRRKLWYEKSGVTPDFPERDIPEFERGHYVEPVPAQLYADKTRRKVDIAPRMQHADYPYMVVHMDRIIHDPAKTGPGYLEIKCVNWRTFKKFKDTGLHESYILQVQHGLAVTGYSWGSYAILCLDPWQFAYFDVERDEAICTKLFEDEKAFMDSLSSIDSIPECLQMPDKRCFNCQYRHTCQKSIGDFEKISDSDLINMPELLPIAAERKELDVMQADITEMLTENSNKAMAAIEAAAKDGVIPAGVMGPGFKILRIQSKGSKKWDSKALWALWDKATPSLKAMLGPYCNEGKEGRPPKASLRYYWQGE
jgi:hypothetical protein